MKKILVIEDSEDIRNLICTLLRKNSEYTVTEAADADEGFKILASIHSFDLLILDYHLPSMTGVDMLRKLSSQSRKATCPVVMITAESEERGSEIKDLNIVCWMVKPINPQRFGIVINQILAIVKADNNT